MQNKETEKDWTVTMPDLRFADLHRLGGFLVDLHRIIRREAPPDMPAEMPVEEKLHA